MPPEVTSKIRRTSLLVGSLLLVAGGLLAVLLGFLAYRLPTSSSVYDTGTALLGSLAAIFICILGFAIVGARRYVADQHLDIAGVAPLRRVLIVLAAGVGAAAGPAFLLVLRVCDAIDLGVLGYLALVVTCPALAAIGTVIARTKLRPLR
jgi:hypothetical protein